MYVISSCIDLWKKGTECLSVFGRLYIFHSYRTGRSGGALEFRLSVSARQ